MVILPNTDKSGVYTLAANIQSVIKNLVIVLTKVEKQIFSFNLDNLTHRYY